MVDRWNRGCQKLLEPVEKEANREKKNTESYPGFRCMCIIAYVYGGGYFLNAPEGDID